MGGGRASIEDILSPWSVQVIQSTLYGIFVINNKGENSIQTILIFFICLFAFINESINTKEGVPRLS